MKKYIILAIIVVVLVGGILTLFWFYPGLFPFGKNKNVSEVNTNQSITSNTNSVANVNSTAINLNLSQNKGSIEVNKGVTYKEVEFQVLTAEKAAEFESFKAGTGKTLVGLYLQKITTQSPAEISAWLKNEVKLTNSKKQTFSLKGYDLAGASAPDYAASYLVFETGQNDTGFILNFGTGEALKSITLGF